MVSSLANRPRRAQLRDVEATVGLVSARGSLEREDRQVPPHRAEVRQAKFKVRPTAAVLVVCHNDAPRALDLCFIYRPTPDLGGRLSGSCGCFRGIANGPFSRPGHWSHDLGLFSTIRHGNLIESPSSQSGT